MCHIPEWGNRNDYEIPAFHMLRSTVNFPLGLTCSNRRLILLPDTRESSHKVDTWVRHPGLELAYEDGRKTMRIGKRTKWLFFWFEPNPSFFYWWTSSTENTYFHLTCLGNWCSSHGSVNCQKTSPRSLHERPKNNNINKLISASHMGIKK